MPGLASELRGLLTRHEAQVLCRPIAYKRGSLETESHFAQASDKGEFFVDVPALFPKRNGRLFDGEMGRDAMKRELRSAECDEYKLEVLDWERDVSDAGRIILAFSSMKALQRFMTSVSGMEFPKHPSPPEELLRLQDNARASYTRLKL